MVVPCGVNLQNNDTPTLGSACTRGTCIINSLEETLLMSGGEDIDGDIIHSDAVTSELISVEIHSSSSRRSKLLLHHTVN